jgi:hypothetical protein
MNDTYISITTVQYPVAGNTAHFSAAFVGTGNTTGVVPTWKVAGAASVVTANADGMSASVVIPHIIPANFLQVSVSATIPETPAITASESRNFPIH